MNHRNGKSFEEPSETPEEVVGLIVNFANRPDLREVQERQVREIKNLIENAKSKHTTPERSVGPEQLEERKLFNRWFNELIFADANSSCLLRDVLRDAKEELWKRWLERKPYG